MTEGVSNYRSLFANHVKLLSWLVKKLLLVMMQLNVTLMNLPRWYLMKTLVLRKYTMLIKQLSTGRALYHWATQFPLLFYLKTFKIFTKNLPFRNLKSVWSEDFRIRNCESVYGWSKTWKMEFNPNKMPCIGNGRVQWDPHGHIS